MASGGFSLQQLHAGKFTMKQVPSYVLQKVLAQSKETFGILVIGDTGSGKSTLINNIFGEEVAKVGKTTYSETKQIACHKGIVQKIPVRIYDTPGLGDTGDNHQVEKAHLEAIQEVVKKEEIALVIFCFKMIETRMSSGNIRTFKIYHKELQLDWKKVIIALTFADIVPHFERDAPPTDVYQSKLKQWKDHIGEVLREKVGVVVSDEDLRIHPVTKEYATKLPDGEEWFTPLWLSVMEVLGPHQMFNYLKMHANRIICPGEAPSDEEFVIVEQLISEYSNTPLDEQSSSNQQLSLDLQPSSDPQLSSDQQPSSDRHPSLAQQTSSSQQPSSDRHPSSDQQTSSSQKPSSDRHPSLDQQPSSSQHPSSDRHPSLDQHPSSNVGIHNTMINLGSGNIQNVDCPQQANDRQQEYHRRFNAVLERGFRAVLQIPLETAKSIAKAIMWAWSGFTISLDTTTELLQSI